MVFSGPAQQTVGSLDNMAKHKAESGKHEMPKGGNDDTLVRPLLLCMCPYHL